MNELTHLDLFSGIGGFALAARAAGFRTVGFSEVEPYACRALKQRFPGIPNLGDVRRRAKFARFRGCTVVTGGFPCQPWSESGLRRGKDDPRHLWPAMCDVIEAVGPAWVIGENVPNLVNMGGLDGVTADLARIGYAAESFAIPACAVGAPQIGERIWIVAAPACERCEESADVPVVACAAPCDDPWQQAGWMLGDFRGRSGRRFTAPRAAFDGVDYGIPGELDRVKALGNAIVPQVAERFFRFIAAIEQGKVPMPNPTP